MSLLDRIKAWWQACSNHERRSASEPTPSLSHHEATQGPRDADWFLSLAVRRLLEEPRAHGAGGSFTLFERAFTGLEVCVRDLVSGRSLIFAEHSTIYRIREMIEGRLDVDAHWARIAIDLWSVGNFNPDRWRPLIEIDVANSRLAIEHALYVDSVSGTRSAQCLGELLAAYSAAELAIAHLRRSGIDRSLESYVQKWTQDVLRSARTPGMK